MDPPPSDVLREHVVPCFRGDGRSMGALTCVNRGMRACWERRAFCARRDRALRRLLIRMRGRVALKWFARRHVMVVAQAAALRGVVRMHVRMTWGGRMRVVYDCVNGGIVSKVLPSCVPRRRRRSLFLPPLVQ